MTDNNEKMNNVNISDEELNKVSGGSSSTRSISVGNQEVFARAKNEIGKPYQWGAVGPEGYDAPGFVGYCLTGEHKRIGTTSTFMGWPRVSDPQPGDVCVSNDTCGIYAGGGSMIIARTFGTCVSYSNIDPNMIIVRG